jgi:hypothetical protein
MSIITEGMRHRKRVVDYAIKHDCKEQRFFLLLTNTRFIDRMFE